MTTPTTLSREAAPIRIQRKRTKGFNLQSMSPDGRPVVSVTRPGRWGNEFRVLPEGGRFFVVDNHANEWGPEGGYATRNEAAAKAVRMYANGWLEGKVHGGELDLTELRGKHLACFCEPGAPCHADTLLLWANADPMPTSENFAFPAPSLPIQVAPAKNL